MKLYYGTNLEGAKRIIRDGFNEEDVLVPFLEKALESGEYIFTISIEIDEITVSKYGFYLSKSIDLKSKIISIKRHFTHSIEVKENDLVEDTDRKAEAIARMFWLSLFTVSMLAGIVSFTLNRIFGGCLCIMLSVLFMEGCVFCKKS